MGQSANVDDYIHNPEFLSYYGNGKINRSDLVIFIFLKNGQNLTKSVTDGYKFLLYPNLNP